jgi:hypothetical protein
MCDKAEKKIKLLVVARPALAIDKELHGRMPWAAAHWRSS